MVSLVVCDRSCRNMKICPRYPYPKSLPSRKGLAIASLKARMSCFPSGVSGGFVIGRAEIVALTIRRCKFKDTTKI